jgi:hypothetical protein
METSGRDNWDDPSVLHVSHPYQAILGSSIMEETQRNQGQWQFQTSVCIKFANISYISLDTESYRSNPRVKIIRLRGHWKWLFSYLVWLRLLSVKNHWTFKKPFLICHGFIVSPWEMAFLLWVSLFSGHTDEFPILNFIKYCVCVCVCVCACMHALSWGQL